MAAILSSLFAFFTSFPRIATVLLWVLLVACVDAQNRSGEVQTLLQFKTLMEKDSDLVSRVYWSTWKATDENPCEWWGVYCTTNLTVEQLDLSGWGLTQTPSFKTLSNLSGLRELDLSANNFKDQTGYFNLGSRIPDDVGSLIGLTKLSLGASSFVGPIPSTISACRNLRYLSLEYNQLTGEIPDLRSLENLTYLYLGGNQLSGPFPQWLGQLNQLLVIELGPNMFNGTIPSLANPNLLEVVLDYNNFTGFQEPLFPGAKSFEHLSVASNQLEGPIPASITELKKLMALDLSDNQLSGHIPSNFSLNMSLPIALILSHNQLTGSIPASLLQPNLAAINAPTLDFSNNLLTGPIPFEASKQYNYYKLDFSNNRLIGNIPSICKNGKTYVEHFVLENNNLSGDILEFFVGCYDHITEMRFANNSFSGDLSRIDYVNASLDLALRVENMQNGVRDLSNNNLQMSTPEANTNPLKAVLEFYVLNTSLVEFRINGNNFSGTPLPADFNLSASSLQVLDLSNNHLTGEISGAAFNSTWFPALQSLNLSNNDITGPIPEAIVMLPNLASLGVLNNRLSGALPTLPASLYYPSFFRGNGGLCGGPLPACSQGKGVQWWVLLIVIGGSVTIALSSCLVVTWLWRKYRKMHQQDAELIKTLRERESASLMSLRELKKATNNFAESAQIGKGGFGIVYTGKLHDGTLVAIKRSNREGSESDKDRFLNEVKILSQINHRHLVKLLGCCMENSIALLVFEFVSNGTLQEHLQGKIGAKRLSWNQRLHIAVQIADALNYLHSAVTFPIYHRDVKSANILVDGDLHAKMADFGISKLVPLEVTHVSTVAIQGTLGYIDPEYFTSFQLNDKSDVYSFGVVLLELISAKPAIDFHRGGDNTSLVSFAKPYIESGDLEHLIDVALVHTYNDLACHGRESILNVGRLAMKCLHMQSQERPSMHNVWKELQNLRLEFQGSSEDFGSIKNDGNKDSLHDHIILLSDSIPCNSSSFSLPSAPTSVQMSLRYPD